MTYRFTIAFCVGHFLVSNTVFRSVCEGLHDVPRAANSQEENTGRCVYSESDLQRVLLLQSAPRTDLEGHAPRVLHSRLGSSHEERGSRKTEIRVRRPDGLGSGREKALGRNNPGPTQTGRCVAQTQSINEATCTVTVCTYIRNYIELFK